jgi:uncharacterized hydrophobic protein (TIGR00271 family)
MIYYIYADDKQDFIEKTKEHLDLHDVTYVPFSKLGEVNVEHVSHFIVTGCLHEIKLLMGIAHHSEISLGIIPTSEQKELMRTFGLTSKIDDALKVALQASEKKIDLMYCNGEIVLQEVVIGDAPPLDKFDSILNGKSYLDRVKIFWRTIKRVKALQHTEFKITDAKENEINLSAVGIVGVEYNNDTFASKLISSQLSANNGKLSIVILSPISIVQYMGYLFKSLVSHLTPRNLPDSVGYIRSSQIYIASKKEMEVIIDSTAKHVTPVELEVKQKALALSVGESFWEKKTSQTQTKDSIKVDHLPSDEESTNYLSKAIPLFSHASKAQYASLFTNLRDESRLSQHFLVLLIFATMIATFGLFINSSSVIIGAMLLAPLMQPIVSLSMGVLRQDMTLQITGARTILIGVLSVLATAALMALFTPIERLTPEMAGRLSPTILDLFVAIVSGAAAAYAKSDEKILGSLAGVAIAVALVPPIAVAGIGLGWADWSMFFSAFLLFITNLVGIVLAAAFMFAILGFSPLHLARKGIITWLVIVAVVAIPLYSSFSQMREDIAIQKKLSNLTFILSTQEVTLTQVELIHRSNIDEIHCDVITTGVLGSEDKKRLKEAILKSIHKDAEVIATFRHKL